MLGMFSFIAVPLGYVMEWIYLVVQNYGFTLIIFTIFTKVIMFPLSIKQQKSSAKMAVYQPYIQEVQKKYANDKQKQQEEMIKLQQEHGISMSAGCLPMIATMAVLFGLIEVIYSPLRYIFHIGTDVIAKAFEISGVPQTAIGAQNALMLAVKDAPEKFTALFGDKTTAIANFNFNFLGIDLSTKPEFGFDMLAIMSLIIPILSIITMIASQIIVQKMSGQQMTGMMKWMPWIMSLMFVSYGFTVPVGFSLYYTMSNVLMLGQSIILKKMYDPEKMKAEFAILMEEKKAAKKQKKQIVVKQADGTEEVKSVNEAELLRIRLAKAREIDEARYKE